MPMFNGKLCRCPFCVKGQKCIYSPVEDRYQRLSLRTWRAVPLDTDQIQQWIDSGLRALKDGSWPKGMEWLTLSGDTCVSMTRFSHHIDVYVYQIKNYEYISLDEELNVPDYDGCAW